MKGGTPGIRVMMDNVLTMENIHFAYDHQTVLQGVGLTLKQGDFLGLVGPNGSGKSTMIKLALGSLRPDSGGVKLFDQPLNRFRDWWKIGFVSQKANSFNLGFPATVSEVVASGLYGKLGLFRRMKKKHWLQVEETLETVGLTPYAHQNIGRLSGGQQQRAFIARALVSEPEFLILDEPTVGVDAESVERFYHLLKSLHKDRGLTLLLVTHDIGAITAHADRIACLNKTIHFHGNAEEFASNRKEILSFAYGHEVQVMEHDHEPVSLH